MHQGCSNCSALFLLFAAAEAFKIHRSFNLKIKELTHVNAYILNLMGIKCTCFICEQGAIFKVFFPKQKAFLLKKYTFWLI
jgi:hypothetical protein